MDNFFTKEQFNKLSDEDKYGIFSSLVMENRSLHDIILAVTTFREGTSNYKSAMCRYSNLVEGKKQ